MKPWRLVARKPCCTHDRNVTPTIGVTSQATESSLVSKSDQRPHHLRLHINRGDDSTTIATSTRRRPSRRAGASKVRTGSHLADNDAIDRFLRAYTDVTGWRLDDGDAAMKGLKGPNFQLTADDAFDAMMTAEDFDSGILPAIGKADAEKLAAAAAELTRQLTDSQAALRCREAELAVLESKFGRASVKIPSIADELQRILSDGVAATGFDAAALYLLNEDTTELKLRCLFGLDPTRLLDPPRDLADCRADLEAMVCGVCTIENQHAVLMDTWNCPESEFGRAICATVNADDLPLGTLWFYGQQPVDEISDAQAAAARLTASQIANEMNRVSITGDAPDIAPSSSESGPTIRIADVTESATDKQVTARPDRADDASLASHLNRLAAWQYETLAIGTRISEDLFVDGLIESPKTWAVGWHHWDVLPDGMVAWLMAEANDPTTAGAMTAAFAKAAAIAHLGYRHELSGLLRRVGDSLWQMGVTGQTCSLMYARLSPDSGEGEIVAAGNLSAMIGGAFGHRPLIAANHRPLATDFDPSFAESEFQLQPGESLLGYNAGLIESSTTDHLGGLLRKSSRGGSRRPLARIAKDLDGTRLLSERSAAVITRRG